MTETKLSTEKQLHCPVCNNQAKRVSTVTLGALLCDELAQQFKTDDQSCCAPNGEGCVSVQGDTGWRFCDSTDCDVVYFSEEGDTPFTKSQLKVPVGVKETTGERPLCYCFKHSVATIKEELRTTGNSAALEDIRAKMKDPGCRCETENPSGTCCLGSVGKGIKIAQEELAMNDMDMQAPPNSARLSGNRGEKIAKVGTVVSAIMASACCWLPLVLLAVGVSGAGIAATLEAYRPLFIVVACGFLGAAFYFTYRPKKAIAAGSDCCAMEATSGDDCCSPSKGRFTMMTMNKVMLWSVTVLAIAFLFFPSYVGMLFGTGNNTAVTENMNQAVFQIDGMTCEGCATTVAQAIRQVPRVVAVEVSYEKKQAVVGVESDSPVPKKKILAALKRVGYSGKLLGREETSEASDSTATATTPSIESDDDQPSSFPSEALLLTVLKIDGMTCEGCATGVSEAIGSVPGVNAVHVDFKRGRARVKSPACCTFPKDAVLSAVENAGFKGQVEAGEILSSEQGP